MVNSGAIVNVETTILSGAGSFTLSSGGTLMIGSPSGITTSGATGNIQTTGTRSYSTGANYTYNGTAAQNPGNGFIEGLYTVTLTDPNGCTATSSTLVAFSNIAYVKVPNVFTPNGDGSNDLFFVQNEGIKDLKCSIFNRCGALIYEINTPQGAWDGKTSAGAVADGSYFYILDAKDFAGRNISEQGNIFIAR